MSSLMLGFNFAVVTYRPWSYKLQVNTTGIKQVNTSWYFVWLSKWISSFSVQTFSVCSTLVVKTVGLEVVLLDAHFTWRLVLKAHSFHDKLSVKHALINWKFNKGMFPIRRAHISVGCLKLLNWMCCVLASWAQHAITFCTRESLVLEEDLHGDIYNEFAKYRALKTMQPSDAIQ